MHKSPLKWIKSTLNWYSTLGPWAQIAAGWVMLPVVGGALLATMTLVIVSLPKGLITLIQERER